MLDMGENGIVNSGCWLYKTEVLLFFFLLCPLGLSYSERGQGLELSDCDNCWPKRRRQVVEPVVWEFG